MSSKKDRRQGPKSGLVFTVEEESKPKKDFSFGT
jgi:hypothetical protein